MSQLDAASTNNTHRDITCHVDGVGVVATATNQKDAASHIVSSTTTHRDIACHVDEIGARGKRVVQQIDAVSISNTRRDIA